MSHLVSTPDEVTFFIVLLDSGKSQDYNKIIKINISL